MLKIYTLQDSAQWDVIVRSFAQYDVYYLSGYVKAFALHGDGDPLLFFYEKDGLRGINVVMKRDVAKDLHFAGKLPEGTCFDFATPYGYGGWLLEGEGDTIPLFAAYEDWCKAHGIVSEFVRFHPVLDNRRFSTVSYQVIPLGQTIALDLASPEMIWSNFESKKRNQVKKAQKNGLEVYSGTTEELYTSFRAIYNKTMDKDHAADYYYFQPEFYQSVQSDLPNEAQVFYVCLPDGLIIASAIMLTANGYMNYHLSGAVREYSNLAPTNLLLYEAALWGCAHGCRTLHLGGGVGASGDSLYHFKKAFYRGEPRQYYIGKKIFDPETYARLLSLRETAPEGTFFPQYRA